MRETTISLMGLYNWDDTLFSLLTLPEGIDDDILIPNLLAETAELEVLYPNPTVMKTLIGVWSQKQSPIWQHMYETTQYEYNPIENYNRYETENADSEDTRTIAETNSGSDSSTSTGTGSQSVTNKVAAFNLGSNLTDENGLAPNSAGSSSSSSTNSGSVTYGKKVNTTDGIERESSREAHLHGNIGVMSTQDMIKQERDIADFNIYDMIIKDFVRRFCIMVY